MWRPRETGSLRIDTETEDNFQDPQLLIGSSASWQLAGMWRRVTMGFICIWPSTALFSWRLDPGESPGLDHVEAFELFVCWGRQEARTWLTCRSIRARQMDVSRGTRGYVTIA